MECRQLEEVIVFAQLLDGAMMDRTVVTIDEFVFVVVRLAAHAIHAFVGAFVDEAVVVRPLEQRLHGFVMPRFGGTDEVVVGQVELLECFLEPGRILVGLFDRCPTSLFC